MITQVGMQGAIVDPWIAGWITAPCKFTGCHHLVRYKGRGGMRYSLSIEVELYGGLASSR